MVDDIEDLTDSEILIIQYLSDKNKYNIDQIVNGIKDKYGIKLTRQTASKYLFMLLGKGIVDVEEIGTSKLWKLKKINILTEIIDSLDDKIIASSRGLSFSMNKKELKKLIEKMNDEE